MWGVAMGGEGAAGHGPRAGGRRECHLEESLDFCEENVDSRVGFTYILKMHYRFSQLCRPRNMAPNFLSRARAPAPAHCAYTSTCLLQGNEAGWHQS